MRSGTVRVAAGRQDGLFRALAVDMDFGPTAPAGLSTLLGSLAGAHLHVQVGLSAPNRPVIVPPPPNPLWAASRQLRRETRGREWLTTTASS